MSYDAPQNTMTVTQILMDMVMQSTWEFIFIIVIR